MDFLQKACEGHPQLRVKIAVDCAQKGYANNAQIAEFLGLSTDQWRTFYGNFQEGDLERIPQELRSLVPEGDLKLLTGFTDEQLEFLEHVRKVPFLMAEGVQDPHPLLKDLRVLLALGLLLAGTHNDFRTYSLKHTW